jgi:hypothetical protein
MAIGTPGIPHDIFAAAKVAAGQPASEERRQYGARGIVDALEVDI